MRWTLQTLADRIRAQLAEADTPAGREAVAQTLASALADADFVRAQFALGPAAERRLLHEDAALGFCLVTHEFAGAREGIPHDHGDSWAIYGQAEGETDMSDFEIVAPATGGRPAQARRVRTYPMRPGDVHVYNEGDVHASSRKAGIRLLRVEGTNLEKAPRSRFERVGE